MNSGKLLVNTTGHVLNIGTIDATSTLTGMLGAQASLLYMNIVQL